MHQWATFKYQIVKGEWQYSTPLQHTEQIVPNQDNAAENVPPQQPLLACPLYQLPHDS